MILAQVSISVTLNDEGEMQMDRKFTIKKRFNQANPTAGILMLQVVLAAAIEMQRDLLLDKTPKEKETLQ